MLIAGLEEEGEGANKACACFVGQFLDLGSFLAANQAGRLPKEAVPAPPEHPAGNFIALL